MHKILYVTTNRGKVNSLQRHLTDYGITVVQRSIDLPEPRSDDVKIIAEQKAISAYDIMKEPLIVLDAGFYIHSLNGFPKAFVNFVLQTIELEGILALVENKERKLGISDRNCEFKHCLAYIDHSKKPEFFESSLKGTIAQERRGRVQEHLWSELSLIFIPEHGTKTLGEMTPSEYSEFWKTNYQEPSCQKKFGEWYSRELKRDL